MNKNNPYLQITCLFILVSLSSLACADDNRGVQLKIVFAGWGDYTCDSSYQYGIAYVDAEYSIKLVLTTSTDIEYEGLPALNPPTGLEIIVEQSSSPDGHIIPSEEHQRDVQFDYFVDRDYAYSDSVWRATGQTPPRWMKIPTYRYSVRIPEQFENSFMVISARWNHPQYGSLITQEPAIVKVIAPCSEKAQHVAWSNTVYSATRRSDYYHSVALADSFIALGWYELGGLLQANIAAQYIGRYDDALRYLDLCFEKNHTIAPYEGWTPDNQPTEADQQIYEMQRTKLIELMNQQRQK